MKGDITKILSLQAFTGRCVTFDDSKKEEIIGIDKVGKSF